MSSGKCLKNLTRDDVERIKKMCLAGDSLDLIASTFGVSISTVRWHLRGIYKPVYKTQKKVSKSEAVKNGMFKKDDSEPLYVITI